MRTDRLLLWFTRRFGAPNDLRHPVDMNNTTRRRKRNTKKQDEEKEGKKHPPGHFSGPLSSTYGVFFVSRLKGSDVASLCLFRSANMCPLSLSLSLWEWNGKGKPSSGCFDSLYGMHTRERERGSLFDSHKQCDLLATYCLQQWPRIFREIWKKEKKEGKMAISKYYNSIWFIFRQQCFPFFRERNKNPVGQFSHESAITLCGFSSPPSYPSIFPFRLRLEKRKQTWLRNPIQFFWTHFLDHHRPRK